MTDWLNDRGNKWMTDWLSDGGTNWMTNWMIGWETNWMSVWQTDWLTDRLSEWQTDWCKDKINNENKKLSHFTYVLYFMLGAMVHSGSGPFQASGLQRLAAEILDQLETLQVNWLIGWLIDFLRLINWLDTRSNGNITSKLIDWLVDWFSD